jgi:hypothetical protein
MWHYIMPLKKFQTTGFLTIFFYFTSFFNPDANTFLIFVRASIKFSGQSQMLSLDRISSAQ